VQLLIPGYVNDSWFFLAVTRVPFIDAIVHNHPKHVAGSPRWRIAERAREHWLIQKLHLNLTDYLRFNVNRCL